MGLPRFLIGTLLALSLATPAAAQTTADFRARCATRLSGVLLGKTATSTLITSTDPQTSVDTMVQSAAFIERFARFINSQYNVDPGMVPAEDASYYLAKYVLTNNKPWKEMFIGQYRVDPGSSSTADAVVVQDTNGLGYFRSPTWMVRYAGNELQGYRLVSAYRMLNNVLGVKLQAAVNTNGVDSNGRMAQPCASCHYNNIFGLDYIAKILSRKVVSGTTVTFSPPNEGPQILLGGQTIADDKQFVTAMVNSLDFRFNVCRTAMKFLYARAEVQCEGPVFDKCMSAFASTGMMQSALAAIAKDPSFCQ